MNIQMKHSDMVLNLVDLSRYPIADISQGEGAEFLQTCQENMEKHGWCNFDGFIHPEGLAILAEEANKLLPTQGNRMNKLVGDK